MLLYLGDMMMILHYADLLLLSSGDDGCHEILWDVVRQYTTMPDIREPSLEDRRALEVTEELFQGSVVAPWYRGMLGDQV
jgi:hypothetical protein